MKALENLSDVHNKQEKQYRVYCYTNSKREVVSTKQYVRIPQAQEPLTFNKDRAWSAILALTSVGIPAWAEEVK